MDLRLGDGPYRDTGLVSGFSGRFMRKFRHAPAALGGTDNGLDGVCAHRARAAVSFAGG
jgi:hypothetical protein